MRLRHLIFLATCGIAVLVGLVAPLIVTIPFCFILGVAGAVFADAIDPLP